MKKITLSLVLLVISTVFTFAAAWQKLDLAKVGGGTINLNINRLELSEGKLYAATFDGIWVSPSANGGDWEAFGLQGQNVSHLSFGAMKLANIIIVATDDATKTASKLYKYNGSTWVVTNLNPTGVKTFGGVNTAMTQIQDANNNTVIIYPTWGGGIWRSADGGDTWTNYAQVATAETDNNGNPLNAYKNVLSVRSFPGTTTLYGTDKVSGSMQYMIWSTDYGVTWNNRAVGNFFNPYSFFVRKVNGVEYMYFGGQNGNGGVLWCSMDGGVSWQGSPTAGVEYWEVRKIIGDDNGKVYTLNTIHTVYVSQLNNATAGWDLEQGLYMETFAPAATGITIPTTRVAPAGTYYYLSDLVKSATKLYVSAIMTDGIYYLDLTNTAVNNPKANQLSIFVNAAQTELIVNTEAGSNITIYSVTGKLLQSVMATSAKATVNIKNLKASVYIVKVISADGQLSTNRFVKK
ncbi:MAG: T9SS type A sorting domain-containing protein [Paludibacter sp.]